MKSKLLLIILLALYVPIFAQQVSIETAQEFANVFMRNNIPTAKYSASSTGTTTSSVSVINPIGKVVQSPVMYAVSQDSAWVLVSADERVTPILAYSDVNTGMFPDKEDMPDGMIALLEWYEQQIQYLRDSTNITTIHEGWQKFQQTSNISNIQFIVPSLLYRDGIANSWKQSGNNSITGIFSKSYNKFCPLTEEGRETYVGCVALAMGQLMWYWQWPKAAIVNDDMGNSLIREYDWDYMPAQIKDTTSMYCVDMVANLLHDVGVSVNMNYGEFASGASPDSIPRAFKHTFYFKSSQRVNRYRNSSKWLNLLKENLNSGWPILYGGSNANNEGHRYIIDGYDSSNRFHINYGYDKSYDGWFTLDVVSEASLYPFNQNAILDIHPNYPYWTPMEISQQEVWDTHFIILNGGPIIIRDKVVENNQDGVIYSGEYVKLTDGFHAQVGSKLHIAVKEVQCENLESSPQRVAPRSSSANEEDAYSNNGEVINNGLETKTCEVIVFTSIYTISGQLIQTTEGGLHDASHLPNGMYILQHRMSDGSIRNEKIANNK